MDMVIPRFDVRMLSHDAPTSGWPDGDQSNYVLHGSRSRRFTYISENRLVSMPLDLCVNFLFASHACFALAAPRIYARRFVFPTEPEVCLAFLHDHGRAMYRVQEVRLKYDRYTDPEVWRLLFNVFVHERSDVKRIVVDLGETFWDQAPWRFGVDAVRAWKGWGVSKARKGALNFVDHMIRLPIRLRGAAIPTHRGVDFALFIEAARTPSQLDFERDLDAAIHDESRRAGRSHVPMVDRSGYCDETRLEYTCYWVGSHQSGCSDGGFDVDGSWIELTDEGHDIGPSEVKRRRHSTY